MQMFPMLAFRWTTPDGTANIFITETNPISISVTIGKAGTSLSSLVYALVYFINEALKHQELEEVIEFLQDITTSRAAFNTNGVQCRSTPEAIAFALTEFKQIKAREMVKKEGA
jgi:hypothetical protein